MPPKTKNIKKYILPVLIIFLFSLLILKGIVSLDPDFGWHWRMGEIITSTGIPKTDPFSYTMPSFPFVDHEWLTNIFIYKLDNFFGRNGPAFLYSFIALLSLVIAGSSFKEKFSIEIFKLSLFILAVGAIFPFSGIRPQVLSWLFLAIWLKIILDEKVFKKYFFLLPLLVLAWANLHGSFAVGIFCLGLVTGLRLLKTKKLCWKEVLCFIFCLVATFVNPYGWRLWGEVWQQVSDSALRFRIAEWAPSFFVPVLPYLPFVSLGYLVYFFREKITWEKLALYLFFLVQSLLGLRYIPLFIIVSLPIYFEVIGYLYEKICVIEFGRQRWQKVEYFWLGLCVLIAGFQIFFTIKDSRSFSEKTFYPLEAISFLREDLPKGNLLSQYNWGGYLIWKLPEKKIFIDGRMPSWRWKADLPGESNNAMDDYLTMQKDEEVFKEQLTKYHITTVLWQSREQKESRMERIISEYLLKRFKKKKNFDLVGFLEKEGWQEIYQDQVAVIYTNELGTVSKFVVE